MLWRAGGRNPFVSQVNSDKEVMMKVKMFTGRNPFVSQVNSDGNLIGKTRFDIASRNPFVSQVNSDDADNKYPSVTQILVAIPS